MEYVTLRTMALASAVLLAQPAQAEIITYDITNPGGPDSIGMVAGDGGTPDPYWRFEKGSTFKLDTQAGTGSISATMINNLGVSTPLDLEFSGLLDTLDGTSHYYVKGQGAAYNPATQDYFTDATGSFDYQPFGNPFEIDPNDSVTGNSVFQFGEGANYTDPTRFGFAAWLEFIHPKNGRSLTWDIYGGLDPRDHPTPVPEPGSVALLGLGLGGIAFARRRKRKLTSA
ncbi:PEP-CTERM sorting domain-containing protein [Parasphingorhabdus sp.]|jgi:hypothetical protein|uniref:PEP-CTERM sorting domain-containing protein n=1 Tax=Parasphingorhabdus sp. TaxID=2709688 RepID=UPI003D2E08FA